MVKEQLMKIIEILSNGFFTFNELKNFCSKEELKTLYFLYTKH